MTADQPRRLLILGGTGEAAALATRAAARFGDQVRITTSLAGRTSAPATPPGALRIGGFGGVAGMRRYLADGAIDLLVDATHPFATQISANAAEATAWESAIQRLALLRPPWRPQPGDDWRIVADAEEAAALLPAVGSVAFLTVGPGELAAFRSVEGVAFAIRMIEPPAEPLTLQETVLILGKGPFDLADERALLQQHRIDVLVTKNSGGAATEAKLAAARAAQIPVVMIDRPAPPPGPRVDSVDAALDWIAARV